MITTRLRSAAVASLLLGGSGLAGLVGVAAPAQAALAPAVSAGCVTGSAATRAVRTGVRRDARDEISQAVADKVERVISSPTNRRAAAAGRGGGTIAVRAHIIVGTRHGDRRHHATKRQVRDQVAWMNLAYSGGEGPGVDTGVRFRLRSISVTKNNRWFHLRRTSVMNQMKKKLHRGNARTLNIYLVQLPHQLLGISTFPWNYRAHKQLDGSVIAYNSLRGGSLPGFNEGDTVVHETGHWLGLLHTFQGGCDPNPAGGDGVADTPAEASPQYQCAERDSCPELPGTDPVHNFMDYAPDACMYQFTAGQAARIQQVRAAYRSSSS